MILNISRFKCLFRIRIDWKNLAILQKNNHWLHITFILKISWITNYNFSFFLYFEYHCMRNIFFYVLKEKKYS